MNFNLEQFASDNYSGICPEAWEYTLKANQGIFAQNFSNIL
ncbi:hypothetical protein [Trichormus sp. NMC-1]|nr:hypothetical protein [Trichormus sp. NMC-1]